MTAVVLRKGLSALWKALLGPRLHGQWSMWRQWQMRGGDAYMAAHQQNMSVCSRALYDECARLAMAHGSGSILEYGCGYGFLLKRIYDAGFAGALAGCDLSRAQLSAARRYFGGAQYKIADLTKLPYGDKEFDVAIGVSVLMYLPEPLLRQALAELKRVSRTVIVVEYETRYFDDTFKQRYAAASDGRHDHDYSALLKAAGFTISHEKPMACFWDKAVNTTEEAGFGIIVARAG